MANVYLLTGSPGTGKTTIITEALARIDTTAGGFYTEEIRVGDFRQGFKIVTLDGQNAVLAHVDFPDPHIGKYGINIDNLDKFGSNAIYKAINESSVIIIDEIGKMELLSPIFKEVVLKAIDSGKKVLGTIVLHPHPFTDGIKRNPKVNVVHISRVNHEQVLNKVVKWLN